MKAQLWVAGRVVEYAIALKNVKTPPKMTGVPSLYLHCFKMRHAGMATSGTRWWFPREGRMTKFRNKATAFTA